MQVLFFLSGVFYDLRKLLPGPWGTVLTRIDPAAAVINSGSAADVLMTMVGGVVRYEKSQWYGDIEFARDIARVIEICAKLRR